MEKYEELKKHFEFYQLPNDSIEFLISLYISLQVFDDVKDLDHVNQDELDHTIWFLLTGIYTNKFAISHMHKLVPLLSNMVLKWHAANNAEKTGKHDEKSFVWRAGYYDIVLAVVEIVHGHQATSKIAHDVLSIYGESFADYKGEF